MWVDLSNNASWLARSELYPERFFEECARGAEDDFDVDQAGVLSVNLGDQADFVVVKADKAADRVSSERFNKVHDKVGV